VPIAPIVQPRALLRSASRTSDVRATLVPKAWGGFHRRFARDPQRRNHGTFTAPRPRSASTREQLLTVTAQPPDGSSDVLGESAVQPTTMARCAFAPCSCQRPSSIIA
jgi:hypothetical protein